MFQLGGKDLDSLLLADQSRDLFVFAFRGFRNELSLQLLLMIKTIPDQIAPVANLRAVNY